MNKGLVHLYYGEGKGKTTAAAGLAVRALGRGMRVVFLQFLKDGSSGEIDLLRKLGAEVFSGPPGTTFSFRMKDEEKKAASEWYNRTLEHVLTLDMDLLVLDELCAARKYQMVDEHLAKQAVMCRPEGREVVITGRNPEGWMVEEADYITEMCCRKHPFEKGIRARKGIEF